MTYTLSEETVVSDDTPGYDALVVALGDPRTVWTPAPFQWGGEAA